ncbi:MAG TPA: hypothetical protein P5548_03135 [Candidatus Moranbacteria bacterium]|nr:hypothetical protein [Candidatus Moranbacteria bacterium]HRZ33863.1 hypothetical protein [Candidatus Moranbacteria bacterium]
MKRYRMPRVTRRFEVTSTELITIPNTRKEELIVNVMIDGGEVPISADKQFRKKFQRPGKKYATLNTTRLQTIGETRPREIEVEYTGHMDCPFRFLGREIDAWFERVKQAMKK